MNELGRPTVMTEEVLNLLISAFSIGASDREACLYANISNQTLYNYQKENPSFLEHKEALKETPLIKARKTIFENLNDPVTAKWYLEKKMKNEFGSQVDLTVRQDLTSDDKNLLREALTKLNARDNESNLPTVLQDGGGQAV